MSSETRSFGTLEDGRTVNLYVLQTKRGMRAEILNYGGILVSLWVRDRSGNLRDVVLGYDGWAPYRENPYAFGALIGRCANRIAQAQLSLNGLCYKLDRNFGRHHLHGGCIGFQRVLWQEGEEGRNDPASLTLFYQSPDGEGGYPGTLDVWVTYRLAEENALTVAYRACSDRDTLVNLTNHSYFNLSGDGARSVCSERLQAPMERFAEIDGEHMPTGRILPVGHTALDLRAPQPIAAHLDINDPHLREGGFDHSWLIDGADGGGQRRAARLEDDTSGIAMDVLTTMPAVQIFTPNFQDAVSGKRGERYSGRAGICFETNFVPNAINLPAMTPPILRAGEEYCHSTTFLFSLVP